MHQPSSLLKLIFSLYTVTGHFVLLDKVIKVCDSHMYFTWWQLNSFDGFQTSPFATRYNFWEYHEPYESEYPQTEQNKLINNIK